MNPEPTYENHVYHPHRLDGLDRNLRKINRADWINGVRCTCADCCAKYESSRIRAERIRARRNPALGLNH